MKALSTALLLVLIFGLPSAQAEEVTVWVHGEVLAEAAEGEAVITATLDTEKLAKVRRNIPVLSLRRL
ncbi:hypothetical protein [Microbulbifer litoralis]|uniref:hypothetical protein n=1 Tax=Microbulbifer litoralis TaxID=2933965 RepID=UPI00202923B7|nr:hypothetical protein [Microbulbifer sp. GX H0434]